MVRLRLFFALLAQRTILAQDDNPCLLAACTAENLDLHGAEGYADYVKRADSY